MSIPIFGLIVVTFVVVAVCVTVVAAVAISIPIAVVMLGGYGVGRVDGHGSSGYVRH